MKHENLIWLLGIGGLLAYLIVAGTIKVPGLALSAPLQSVNPNWPKDADGNSLTPGTIVQPSAEYPNGGVVNMQGYVT